MASEFPIARRNSIGQRAVEHMIEQIIEVDKLGVLKVEDRIFADQAPVEKSVVDRGTAFGLVLDADKNQAFWRLL